MTGVMTVVLSFGLSVPRYPRGAAPSHHTPPTTPPRGGHDPAGATTMPRVESVQHARKPPGECGKCGTTIKAGDPYRHWSFRYGGKHIRCMSSTCTPRNSDLTQSKYAAVWSAVEDAEDTIDEWGGGASGEPDDVDTITDVLQAAADAAREVAAEYEEAADAMEQNGGSAGEQNRERAQQLETWADTVEGVSFDDPPDPGCDTCTDGKVECPSCDGTGSPGGDANVEGECDDCDGTGESNCTECDGEPDTHYDADAVSEWEDTVRAEATSALNDEGFEA